ncbi:hypothetical protein [Chelatococcus sp. YT9]|nr:hypothetical protein [Chelatococcus sp. YT9]MBS7696237.1 hypothetical protein [Chelatococcus sp. YT9]MBS7697574.1 hypothetical protein [Chelatococcus sp. YT9]
MQLTLSVVAQATGVPLGALCQWVQRGALALGEGDTPPAGQGHAALLGKRRLAQVAIVGALTRAGAMTGRAVRLAYHFSDKRDGLDEDGAFLRREPGELYAGRDTYLVAAPGAPPQIVGAPPGTAHSRIIAAACNRTNPAGTLVLHLDPIVSAALTRAASLN